jgi:hypothetical protein
MGEAEGTRSGEDARMTLQRVGAQRPQDRVLSHEVRVEQEVINSVEEEEERMPELEPQERRVVVTMGETQESDKKSGQEDEVELMQDWEEKLMQGWKDDERTDRQEEETEPVGRSKTETLLIEEPVVESSSGKTLKEKEIKVYPQRERRPTRRFIDEW